MNHSLSSLTLFLLLSSLLLPPPSTSQLLVPTPSEPPTPASGTIQRTTRQQILSTIPPDSPSSSPPPFLTSPSGKYSAFLLRTPTAPGAGGFGNDFCYIQVQDTETSTGVWESECTPVSTANACSLVFSDDGLAIFDGSNSQWDTSARSAHNNPLESLELVDEGDMRIRDKIGELAWRASEDPRVNQRCGEPGSTGLAPSLPPFAQPIGGNGNLAFGQQGKQGGATVNGAGQVFGFGDEQPLVDNSPFDSGSGRGDFGCWSGIGWAIVGCWLACGFIF